MATAEGKEKESGREEQKCSRGCTERGEETERGEGGGETRGAEEAEEEWDAQEADRKWRGAEANSLRRGKIDCKHIQVL